MWSCWDLYFSGIVGIWNSLEEIWSLGILTNLWKWYEEMRSSAPCISFEDTSGSAELGGSVGFAWFLGCRALVYLSGEILQNRGRMCAECAQCVPSGPCQLKTE